MMKIATRVTQVKNGIAVFFDRADEETLPVAGAAQIKRLRGPKDPNGHDESATYPLRDVAFFPLNEPKYRFAFVLPYADVAEGDLLFTKSLKTKHEHPCPLRLECGGDCTRETGHAPPCLCIGDNGVPGECPA